MAEQQSRIATLLNSGSGTAAVRSSAGPADPRSYDVPAGKTASDAQLAYDSSPDALISVDGHQVAAGDDGVSVDIAPSGSTHVIYIPPIGTQPPDGRPTQNGQPVSTAAPGSRHTAAPGAQPLTFDSVVSQPNGSPAQGGTGQSGTAHGLRISHGTQANAETGHGQPGTAHGLRISDGTQAKAETGTAKHHDVPIEHLEGHGAHAAQADLAMHGPGTRNTDVVTHQNPDGSVNLTIPKGHGNPEAFTVRVRQNDDGSLDLTIPKGHGHPHEVKVHVQPDKHVDLNITRDKHGHLKIDAHDHKPGQDDWSGLTQPAGQGQVPGTGDPTGNTVGLPPNATIPTGQGQQPGTGDPLNGNPLGNGTTGSGNGAGGSLQPPALPTGATRGSNRSGDTAAPQPPNLGTIPADINPGRSPANQNGAGQKGGSSSNKNGDSGSGRQHDTGNDTGTNSQAAQGMVVDPASVKDFATYVQKEPAAQMGNMVDTHKDVNVGSAFGLAAGHLGLDSSFNDVHRTVQGKLETGHTTLNDWWTKNLNYVADNTAYTDAQLQEQLKHLGIPNGNG